MKKLITTLLAICLLAGLLAVPASAAAPGDWTGWFSGWNWPDWFYQPAEPEPEEPEQIEQEVTEPEYEESEPEQAEPETEEPEATQEYTIRYDANGGYWWSQYASPAMSTTKKYTVEAGEVHKIIGAPIRTGYTLQGWEAPDGSVYQPGEKITPTESMTLKAVWG